MMRKITLILLSSVFAPALFAQQWQSTYGPMTNTAWDIKEYNNTLFLAADFGNYSSTDGGDNWTSINLPCPEYGGSITSFWLIDQKIYFRNLVSTDGGLNWALTSNPDDALIKYIKDSSFIFSLSVGQGPYVSADSGVTWQDIKRNLPLGGRTGMAIVDHKIYVATYYNGVYVTSLIDSVWHPYNSGLPSAYYLDLETYGKDLFLALGQGIYRYASGDSSWRLFSDSVIVNSNIQRIFIKGQTIYVGATMGTYRSPVTNFSWQLMPNTEKDEATSVFVKDSVLFMGFNGRGLYKTFDDGLNWTLVNKGIYAGNVVNSMAVSNGSIWTSSSCYHPVHKTNDQAQNWKEINIGDAIRYPSGYITSLFANGNDIYFGEEYGGIYCSHDSGSTWMLSDSTMLNNMGHNVRAFAALNNDIYAAYYNNLLKSSDKGLTWNPVNTLNASGNIYEMVTQNNELFAVVNRIFNTPEIYKTADGINWTLCCTLPNTYCNGRLSASANNLYAYTSSSVSILLSIDQGATWTTISTSGLPGTELRGLLAVNNELFVTPFSYGQYGSHIPYGIYRYYNGSWQPYNTGLNQLNINCLASDGSFLYAGVDWDGVYKTPVPINVEVKNNSPSEFTAEIYPNPTEGVLSIKLGNAHAADVLIYDVHGTLVIKTVIENSNGKVDLSKEKKGIYMIEFISGAKRATRKIILH